MMRLLSLLSVLCLLVPGQGAPAMTQQGVVASDGPAPAANPAASGKHATFSAMHGSPSTPAVLAEQATEDKSSKPHKKKKFLDAEDFKWVKETLGSVAIAIK